MSRGQGATSIGGFKNDTPGQRPFDTTKYKNPGYPIPRNTFPGLNTLNEWRESGRKSASLGYRVVTVLCVPGNLISLVAYTALTLTSYALRLHPTTRRLNDFFWERAENSWGHLKTSATYDLLGL